MDKWFEKGYHCFNESDYLSRLFLQDSLYAIPPQQSDGMLSLERAQHMIDIFQKVKDYPSSVYRTSRKEKS